MNEIPKEAKLEVLDLEIDTAHWASLKHANPQVRAAAAMRESELRKERETVEAA